MYMYFTNYGLSTLGKKSGAIMSCADKGTEEGSSPIAMQGNGESDAGRMHMALVPIFSKAKEEWRGCKRYTVIWRLLKLVNSRKLEESRTESLKTD